MIDDQSQLCDNLFQVQVFNTEIPASLLAIRMGSGAICTQDWLWALGAVQPASAAMAHSFNTCAGPNWFPPASALRPEELPGTLLICAE